MERIRIYDTYLYCLNEIETTNGEDDPIEYTDNYLILDRMKEKLTADEIKTLETLYYAGLIKFKE